MQKWTYLEGRVMTVSCNQDKKVNAFAFKQLWILDSDWLTRSNKSCDISVYHTLCIVLFSFCVYANCTAFPAPHIVVKVVSQVCLKLNSLSHTRNTTIIERLRPITNLASSVIDCGTQKRFIFPYSTLEWGIIMFCFTTNCVQCFND